MDGLLADVRLAARRTARRPGASAAAVVVLALGVGLAAAVFGVVDRVLLQPTAGGIRAARRRDGRRSGRQDHERTAGAGTTSVAAPAASPNAPASSTGTSSAEPAPAASASSTKPAASSPRWPWILTSLRLVIAAAIGTAAGPSTTRVRWASTPCGVPAVRSALVHHAGHASANGNGHHGGNGKGDLSVLAETVLARMNSTEEYLEKTVTLREQPVPVITAGPGSGRVFTLSHEMTCLGRAKLNDIVLEDISVSSKHCRVRPRTAASSSTTSRARTGPT